MRGQIEACGNILWKIVTMLTCKLCSFEPRMVARDSSNYLVAGFLRNVPQDRWSPATHHHSCVGGRETDCSTWGHHALRLQSHSQFAQSFLVQNIILMMFDLRDFEW